MKVMKQELLEEISEENGDKSFCVFERVKRGVDNFRIGQLLVVGMVSMMDNNFYPKMNKKQSKKRGKDIKNAARMPAVIVGKTNEEFDKCPGYAVDFWSRSYSGEMSGRLSFGKDMFIWRYLSSDIVKEGTPPKWILKSIQDKINEHKLIVEESRNLINNPEEIFKNEYFDGIEIKNMTEKELDEIWLKIFTVINSEPEYVEGISCYDMCYIMPGDKKDGSNDYWVYPFKNQR